MPLYTRKTVLLAKAEVTYGTDPVPTAIVNAVQIRNVSLTPQELDVVDRDLVRPYMGSSPQLVVGQKVMLDFECEITGANGADAGKAPKFDALLQACGLAGVANATTSYDYTPVSSAFKSVTLYTFIDSQRHKIIGCMGNVEFDISVKGIPVMKFKFTGKYDPPTDVTTTALSGLTFTGWGTPLGVNNANTPTFSIHGYSAIMSQFNLNLNNTVSYQSLVGTGGEFVTITDRKPTGSCTIQLPPIATKDFYAIAKDMTLGALDIVQGTVALNKFEITSSNVQIIKPTLGDLEGVRMLQLQLGFIPSGTGNNEVTIKTL